LIHNINFISVNYDKPLQGYVVNIKLTDETYKLVFDNKFMKAKNN